jgi:hypothetical protein
MPSWDVRERHHVRVAASPEATYAALHTTDLASSPLARALLMLRALPGALRQGAAGVAALRASERRPVTLADVEARGFRLLEERPPHELVIGLEGQFWRPTGNICTPAPDAFRERGPTPGTARAAWDFTVRAAADGTTALATETRVQCADAATRRRFLPYWYLIRPGSGLIRLAMLRAVRDAAEAGART